LISLAFIGSGSMRQDPNGNMLAVLP